MDLPDRQAELRRDVQHVVGAADLRPRADALLQARHRRLEHDRRAVAERERCGARRRDHHDAAGALLERAQQPGAVNGLDQLKAVEAQAQGLERADEVRLRHEVAVAEIAHVGQQERLRDGGRDERRRVGAGDDHRQRRVAGQQRRQPADGLRAARVARECRHDAQSRAGAIAVQARAEQEARQARAELHGTLGQRHDRLAVEQAQRAVAAQRRVHGEAAQDVGGGDARALQQLADETRRRELTRDVVLQVGEQPAVARAQLGRGAEPEHRGVERVQPQARGRLR